MVKKEEEKKRTEYIMSKEWKDALAEVVYRKGKACFCIWDFDSEKYRFRDLIETPTKIYMPPRYLERLVEAKPPLAPILYLPSEPKKYGTVEKLSEKSYRHLYKYIDYPDDYRQFDVIYSRLTWLYDRFASLAYRRSLGWDVDIGKTRWLMTLGSICYRGTIIGASATPAPVFRLTDAIRGTGMFDENYFKMGTDVGQAILLVLNSGYSASGVVTRCVPPHNDPYSFRTYSPKLIAARREFPDEATTSRTVSHYGYQTQRLDIPPQLLEPFYLEALEIRNMLFMWRLRNYRKVKIVSNKELKDIRVTRIKETILPLISVTNKHEKKWIKNFASKTLVKDIESIRAQTTEALVLEAIFQSKTKNKKLTMKNISEECISLDPSFVDEEDNPYLTPKRVGWRVRHRLMLKDLSTKPTTIRWSRQNRETLARSAQRYGLSDLADSLGLKIPQVTIPHYRLRMGKDGMDGIKGIPSEICTYCSSEIIEEDPVYMKGSDEPLHQKCKIKIKRILKKSRMQAQPKRVTESEELKVKMAELKRKGVIK